MSSCDSPTNPIDQPPVLPRRSPRRRDQAALPQFRLVRSLGVGATSRVYLAPEPSGTPIVVKLMCGRFSGDCPLARRHRRALSRVASMQHPNIMPIQAWGRAADGRSFIVMPWAEHAHDLRTWMDGPMGVEDAVPLGLQLLAGVGHLHQAGLVHGDVKPRNCLVHPGKPSPRLELFDFGSVVRVGRARLVRPGTGASYGTPAYLAPERHDGLIGATSDLYSVGVMLFESLTGRRPFMSTDPEELRRQQVRDPVPFVKRIAPHLPSRLDPFFTRALAKHPLSRFRSARAMARALRAAMGEAQDGRVLSAVS